MTTMHVHPHIITKRDHLSVRGARAMLQGQGSNMLQ